MSQRNSKGKCSGYKRYYEKDVGGDVPRTTKITRLHREEGTGDVQQVEPVLCEEPEDEQVLHELRDEPVLHERVDEPLLNADLESSPVGNMRDASSPGTHSTVDSANDTCIGQESDSHVDPGNHRELSLQLLAVLPSTSENNKNTTSGSAAKMDVHVVGERHLQNTQGTGSSVPSSPLHQYSSSSEHSGVHDSGDESYTDEGLLEKETPEETSCFPVPSPTASLDTAFNDADAVHAGDGLCISTPMPSPTPSLECMMLTSEDEAVDFEFLQEMPASSIDIDDLQSTASSEQVRHQEIVQAEDTNDEDYISEPDVPPEQTVNQAEDIIDEDYISDPDDPPEQILNQAEGIINPEENIVTNHGFDRLKKGLAGDLRDTVKQPVIVSKGEILLNALALCRKHNWGHREKSDVLKFVNSFFSEKVVPDTRYLLDQLFVSQENVHFFFYCKSCSYFFGELSQIQRKDVKILNCENPLCQCVNNVSNLLDSNFFVTFDIPSQLELLFQSENISSKLHNVFDTKAPDGVIGDIYSGTCYQNFVASLSPSNNTKIISFSLSVDGAALFVNSQCSIWPCLLMVQELPPALRMKHLLMGGLWFGKSKAQMDLFLKPIADHLKSLGDTPFSITVRNEIWNMKAYLLNICVDSGARGDVQGIHSHRGECGCSWCLQNGIESDNARRYPFIFPPAEPRTSAGMLQDATVALQTNTVVNGVKFVPCTASQDKYDNVDGMITEWLHVADEGNAKTFTVNWSSSANERYYIGSPCMLEEIEKRILATQPPLECRKYMRSFRDKAFWTGREWENWLLFFSVPILMNLLPPKYLNHWICFVQAAHILLKEKISLQLLDLSERLLIEFVGKTQELYGLRMMKYNLHLLLHVPKNVLRWGALWAISGFTFEKGNQVLKKMVSAANGIPLQICRAISENGALLLLKNSLQSKRCDKFCDTLNEKRISNIVQVGNVKLMGFAKLCHGNLSQEEKWLCARRNIDVNSCQLYNKIQMEGKSYSVKKNSCQNSKRVRSDNSIALLSDNRVVQVVKFLHIEGTDDVFGFFHVVRCRPHLCPPEVQHIDISACFLQKVVTIDQDKILEPVHLLKNFFVNLEYPHGHFVYPFPNVYNFC